ncbi:MAG: response regulator [Eubacteriales bacterium]|nr:response regulator [Eubacteriales bacterium]
MTGHAMMEKQTILIIDDDPNTRKILSDILKIKGYEPFTAKDGTEGLAFLEKGTTNLVLIDLGLPDMSGLEILSSIKTHSPSVETIILTGNASLDSAIEATNKGTFSYLQKPCDMDQLMLHIKRALEKQAAQATIIRHGIALEKINAELSRTNAELTNEIAERKRTEEEKEGLILELREALSKIKILSGLLPICAHCKRIRNDKGQWEQMEIYIRDRSEAEFTHGICLDCLKKFYPDLYKPR